MVIAGVVLAAIGLLATRPVQGEVVVVAVPGLMAEDLRSGALPHLGEVARRGVVGWLNCRTARIAGVRGEPPEAQWVSLGAGARATSAAITSSGTDQALEALRRANRGLDHPVEVGALETALRRAGLSTCRIGCEDAETPGRAAAFLLGGTGAAEQALVRDPLAPYGVASDLRAYVRAPTADVALWVMADLQRTARYADRCLPTPLARMRAAALARLDALVDLAERRTGASGAIIVLAPGPGPAADPADRLAPIVAAWPGLTPGRVRCGSTRRDGLATNLDLAPTILRLVGATVPGVLVGRPMTSDGSGPNDLAAAADLHDMWVSHSQTQRHLGGLPTLQLVLLGLILYGIVLGRRSGGAPSPTPAAGALLAAIPCAMVVLPLVSDGVASGAASLLLVGAAVLWLAWRRDPAPIAVGSLFLELAVVASGLLVFRSLIDRSWLGASVMEGARYYGIGNELGGAVAVAVAVVATRVRSPWWSVALWTGAAALAGLPALGANVGVGAAIALGGACGFASRGGIRTWRVVLAGVLSVAALVACLIAADLLRSPDGRSHLGRAVTGSQSIFEIAGRKAVLNGYLLLHSPWSPCLLTAGGGLAIVWRGRRGGATDGPARVGVAATLVGLLVFNDSGVVAAAVGGGVALGVMAAGAAPALLDNTAWRHHTDNGPQSADVCQPQS